MSENARDTQFTGFAELLWQEIRDTQRRLFDGMDDGLVHSFAEWDEVITKRISQRAYDLACHVTSHTVLTAYWDMSKIPDLTTWPEVQE